LVLIGGGAGQVNDKNVLLFSIFLPFL